MPAAALEELDEGDLLDTQEDGMSPEMRAEAALDEAMDTGDVDIASEGLAAAVASGLVSTTSISNAQADLVDWQVCMRPNQHGPILKSAPRAYTFAIVPWFMILPRGMNYVRSQASTIGARWCKTCKAIFEGDECEYAHADFMYTDSLPEEAWPALEELVAMYK